MQAGHDDVLGQRQHRAVEQQGQHHQVEQPAQPQLILGQRIRRHGADQDIAQRPRHRNQQGVEQVAGEGHPGIAHDVEQRFEVAEGRILGEQLGRIEIQLTRGLERLADHQDQRQRAEYGEKGDDYHDKRRAGTGPVRLPLFENRLW